MEILRKLFYLGLVVFLGLACLYGIIVPEYVPVVAVSPFTLGKYENGLSLTQTNKHYYYTVSPFNDYFLSGTVRSTFFTKEEVLNNSYTSDFNSSHIVNIIDGINNYFDKNTPSISFAGVGNKSVSYLSKVEGNKVTVTGVFTPESGKSPDTLGITLSYSGIDFVFDKQGNLYTFREDADVEYFNKLYGVSLIKQPDKLHPQINDREIYIFNPQISGIIKVKAKANQRLYLNREARLIEVEQDVKNLNNQYAINIDIELFQDPQEALK